MESQFQNVQVLDHPLTQAKLSILRAEQTSTEEFRRTLHEISMLLLMQAARSWSVSSIEVVTPLQISAGAVLSKGVTLVPILRAGLGMLEGMWRLVPDARVGHIGLYRDEITLRPISYYHRLPKNIAPTQVLVLDPMLATGYSACEAVRLVKEQGAENVQFVSVVACPAGITQLHAQHDDVPIVTAAIDPELNQFGYIVPGLGDAGDRYFGTG
ncbi:MAG: uracil phosphoribosyltransferase [Chthoniobacterales bacterium]